jgi:1-phosphatidylinositol-3-phosphate 5-kinase
LIELGPSYFRYMDKTTKKPSVMAKLLGFYTVKVKNMETGAIQSKADLLIMENLFHGRKISQTFDLKGIEYVH